MQERRRGVAPVQTERAVVLLDVTHPELGALEVERLEDAGAGHHPHRRAVGDRRRRRHVLLALLVVAAAERPLPERLALLAIDRPELEVAALHRGGDIEEDVIVPDDRRCAAAARHRQLPGDVLFRRPLDRQPLLAADAVGERAAPRRPVLGRRQGRDKRQAADAQEGKEPLRHYCPSKPSILAQNRVSSDDSCDGWREAQPPPGTRRFCSFFSPSAIETRTDAVSSCCRNAGSNHDPGSGS